MKTELLENVKQFIRSGGFAWPGGAHGGGGYQCALMMADGEVIDASTARENFRQIAQAEKDARTKNWPDRQWQPVAVFIHWQGEPLYCAHSNRPIPSTYGEIDG